ncbi:acyltransferase family protein [Biformimicrobium ophioploci]|uniref:Acyltransferase family protein n=1 Tax=Biformimicrobium ophioploci TaxID=3036711 RepID=A0ABQ6M1J2_9GAMM|nr:acyltransferase family protein [Microbulbifer sp. NKW57]GMG88218.1 acyltransferase family protein [Microbulbifer sp. NKW57]
MQAYRRDIEGLRAIAVLLVVFYHLGFPGISGGFVGVDVFFVISGFVITRLLDRSISNGTFTFSDFYGRRVKRLVPVFLLVSFASFLMISPFYMDDDYYIFAKSWVYSLFGLSNFYYYAELSRYFAPDTQAITLLHTWSLAVEEQFYLLWPALMLALYRWVPRARQVSCLVVGWLVLFALSVHLAEQNPSAAYYLLPARAFELLLGAGLALSMARGRLPAVSPRAGQWLVAAGLVLIGVSAFSLTSADHFPGYNALWPTLGTALAIFGGQSASTTHLGRLLGSRPMVFLGGISYSLYLWHWPPVALLNYQLVELTLIQKLLLVAVLIGLSWASYHLVENRFRYRSWSLRRSVVWLLAIPFVFIWSVQTTIRVADDLSFRIPEAKRELYAAISQSNAGALFKPCFRGDFYAFERGDACRFGVARQGVPENSVLIGDSHATAAMGFVDQLLEDADLSLLLVTQASTPFITEDDTRRAYPGNEEKRLRNLALMEYLSGPPKTVFVGAWWNSYLRNPAFEGYFHNAIAWLLSKGHRVIVLEAIPELPTASFAHCVLKGKSDCSLPVNGVKSAVEPFSQFKQRTAARFPQLEWLSPALAMCDSDRCQTVLNGVPLYRDDSHLNHRGAMELGRAFVAQYGNPLVPVSAAVQGTSGDTAGE